jgi:predicted permease
MSGLISVGVIVLIFSVGFFLALRDMWPNATPAALSFIAVKVAAPCLAITSITERFSRQMLADSVVLLLIALLHLLAQFLLSKLLSRLLKLRSGKKTIFEVTFTYSNVIFIGLPVNQIVFGHEGVPFLFAYYIILMVAFWSFGVASIAGASPVSPLSGADEAGANIGAAGASPLSGADEAGANIGATTANKSADTDSAKAAKSASAKAGSKRGISLANIFNPGFIGVIAGAALAYFGIKLPTVLDMALTYLADLTVPLSLLVIGANLTVFAKGLPRISADEIVIMAGKFIISPLLIVGLLWAFGVEGTPFWVFLLSSTMPCHMQTSILANHYDVEPEYASKLVGVSTLISIVTIPLYVTLIHYWS